ncbi:MAG: hypothetical protein KJN96_11775 [Eudoraea sp.]|nr:hypothetical protein [Eudoraea sp.]
MIQGRYLCSTLLIVTLLGLATACKQNPKEQGPFPVEAKSSMAEAHKNIIMDVHQIKVEEIFPGTKYVYLRVQEGDQSYWMATGPTKVEVGDVYYYNEALVKTNFESKEMQKVFDTLYLVTQLVPEAHGKNLKARGKVTPPPKSDETAEAGKGFHSPLGSGIVKKTSISDLLGNPGEFEGKLVEIKGECTKINTGILSRNWIHLKDLDGNDKSIVITSQEEVTPGDLVTFRARVAIDKDFGAGYTYEVLLEKGVRVN